MKRFMTQMLTTILVAALAAPLAAQTGRAFTFQGRLDQAGQPFNGPVNLLFDLYDADAGGNSIGSQSLNGVAIIDGLFTVKLNSSGEFGSGAFVGERRWLKISVNGTPLSPRQELTAAPNSLHSAGPWVTNGQDISYVGGAVGVGTGTPVHPLDVAGDTKLRGRLAIGNDAGFGINSPYGYADFDISHIHSDFATSPNWAAFRSYITFDPDINLPVSSLFSHDFQCVTTVTNNHDFDYLQGPYLAAFHEGGGNIGLLAGGNIGAQTAGNGSVDLQIGGYIFSVLGTGGAGTGSIQHNEGLEIITGNAGAAGASIVNDYSMYVYSPNHQQPMTNHYGIYLEDQDFGQNDSYAIYSAGGNSHFAGDVEVTGTLSKGAGAFKIDHPLDPENKFLYHSFVESPDMKNIYDGTAVLDTKGEAVVTLSSWFEALNCDFRYQLTCIGGFAPIYIADEIKGNTFRIAGGRAGLKVSWQVTGIRHDAYAKAHRIPVELDKPADLRGAYLHPLEHGKSLERGIEADHRQSHTPVDRPMPALRQRN